MINFLLGVIFLLGVSAVVLYIKMKADGKEKATLQSESDQRVASELAAIKVELDRRKVEEWGAKDVKSAKEAIALRNAIISQLGSDGKYTQGKK